MKIEQHSFGSGKITIETRFQKQDSFLDSEIRIMNAKLIDFEELQCNKQRLLSKKNGGAGLLKEERFRKQMQSKFVSNLKQLANLLKLLGEAREDAI